MTGREPVNIRRLLRENEQYAAAQQYAQDVQRGDAVSSWHEQQSRKSSRPEQMPHGDLQSVDLKSVSCSPKDRMRRQLAEEILLLKRAALMARKQRMRDRLQQDYIKVQQELSTRGLAIAPSID
ncbi:hypothetical protein ABBQ38_015266 [Trebouxia sp. C0009 RCD-2024]